MSDYQKPEPKAEAPKEEKPKLDPKKVDDVLINIKNLITIAKALGGASVDVGVGPGEKELVEEAIKPFKEAGEIDGAKFSFHVDQPKKEDKDKDKEKK